MGSLELGNSLLCYEVFLYKTNMEYMGLLFKYFLWIMDCSREYIGVQALKYEYM